MIQEKCTTLTSYFVRFTRLLLPHVDYCSQLWMPIQSQGIQTIEKLQKNFFYRIPAIRSLNYWEQLKEMKMISLQRRLERYRILYTWKTIEGLVPNCGLKVKTEGGRIGRTVAVPKRNTSTRAAVQTKKEQTFQVNGPQLFNSLPAHIRNLTKCDLGDFKMKLNKFLEQIPDEPNVAGLTPGASTTDARPSNSILDQVRRVQKA